MNSFGKAMLSGVSLATLLWAGQAFAQSGAAPATASTVNSLEEVVVHARRREEALANVPVAVTAIGERELAERNITRIEELSSVAPNVVIRESVSGGAIEINIRGQQVAISNPANDPPVGIYYDDVYVAQSKGAVGGVFDLQGVEVARGVQGTLSGRNNTGGAVRFYSRKPELGEFSGELSGSYGNLNLRRLSGVINVPIGETLAIRLGYSDTQQDGQGRSVITGQPFGGLGQKFLRASALWRPSANFSNHFVFERTRIDEPQVNTRAVLGTNAACAVAAGTATCGSSPVNVNQFLRRYPASVIAPADWHDNSWDFVSQGDHVDVDFYRDTTTWDISHTLTAKLILGYRDMKALSGLDVDASPAFVAHSRNFGAFSYQTTVEPQLLGSLFDNRLEWVMGYFHFVDNATQPSTTLAAIGGNPPGTLTVNILDKLVNTSDAVYLHGEYSLSDRWRAAAGLRYTKDDREYHPGRNNGIAPNLSCALRTVGNAVITPAGACPPVKLEAEFDYVSYELSSTYEFNDHFTGYVRTGRGQKSGGFTSPLVRIDTPAFSPEEVTDYEVGLHARRVAGGVLDFNLAAFFSDYANMQRYTSSAIAGVGIASQTLNAGAATIKGAELDATWRATDALTFSGFVGYTDAKYDKFDILDAAFVRRDLSANRFYQTPEITSRLGFTYDMPVSYGKLRFGGDWYHQSSSSLYLLEFPQLIQPAYDLFSARVTWTSPDEKFDFSVWGTNLSDEDYAVSATASPVSPFDTSLGLNSAGLVTGDGRMVGATVTYHWGS